MKFCWSKIDVKDIDKSIAFYNEVIGLEVVSRFEPESNFEIAFLGNDETKIELVCNKAATANPSPINGISLGFMTEDLNKTIEFFNTRNIAIEAGPISPNPNITFIYIRDPDGVQLQIIESKSEL